MLFRNSLKTYYGLSVFLMNRTNPYSLGVVNAEVEGPADLVVARRPAARQWDFIAGRRECSPNGNPRPIRGRAFGVRGPAADAGPAEAQCPLLEQSGPLCRTERAEKRKIRHRRPHPPRRRRKGVRRAPRVRPDSCHGPALRRGSPRARGSRDGAPHGA